jgi:hypothetical protein
VIDLAAIEAAAGRIKGTALARRWCARTSRMPGPRFTLPG